MNLTVSAAMAVVVALAPSIVCAQAGQDRLRDVLTVGRHVSIVDDEGRRSDGRVSQNADDAVKISRRGGEVEVPFSRIVLVEKMDSVRNGAFIGLGVGLAIGVATVQINSPGDELPAGFAVTSIAVNGLMCMGIGTALDAMFDHRRTLYARSSGVPLRVAPIVGRGRAGISLALSW